MTAAKTRKPAQTEADLPESASTIPTAHPQVLPEKRLVSTALLDEIRKHRDNPQEWPLNNTLPGLIGMVRHIDMTDPDVLLTFPVDLLQKVMDSTNETEIREGRATELEIKMVDDSGRPDFEKAQEIRRQERRLVNLVCCKGFITPRLIMIEADRESDEDFLVEDIHPADRRAYFDWTMGKRKAEADKLATFPGTPDSGLANRQARRVAAAKAK